MTIHASRSTTRAMMEKDMKWFDRSFPTELPLWMFPNILERLRGTPARLEERFNEVPADILLKRLDEKWSIQENAGHLLALEPLWSGRLDDFMSGAEKLRATDLTNKATDLAAYNAKSATTILQEFRAARREFVSKLERLSKSDYSKTALHPRLNKPMTITDKMFFVAEHDDHHLARISAIFEACCRTN